MQTDGGDVGVPMAGVSRRGFLALGAYLEGEAVAGQRRVLLPFATIEATILRRALPAAARSPGRHRGWWYAEASAYHAWYGWRSVSWRVETVDLAAEAVTFTRG